MNLLCPHIHKPNHGLDLIGRWKPSAATLMDATGDFIRKVRQASPATVICYRKYEDGLDFTKTDPEKWASAILTHVRDGLPDYAYTINEPFGHDDVDLFAPFDEWQARVARKLKQLGVKPLGCVFGTGNFTQDGPNVAECFPKSIEECDALGPHDYSWPTMSAGAGWYCLRWLQWHEDIKAATGKDMKFLIGECGLTQAVIAGRPDHGWRSGGPEGVTDESYLATLKWYNERLCEWDAGRGLVLGACLFNFYDQYHWTFEHVGKDALIEQIMALDAPTKGATMNFKIYDADGNEKDWNWLTDRFGQVGVHDAEDNYTPQAGQTVYKLACLREKAGISAILINVRDEDGNPVEGETVMFGWKKAPAHGYEDKGWNWTTNGIVSPTNASGDAFGGMGTGGYYSPDKGEKGPHWVWVWDNPSDMVDGLGMLGATNHIHLDVGYKAVVWDDSEPEPEPEPECGWTMDSVESVHKPGTRLLVGKGLPHGTKVTAKTPWGHECSVTAGSKPEHGAGGFEFVIWHPATYTLAALGCDFTVEVGDDEIVTCTFVEGEPPEPQARVVSAWMDEEDAELLLDQLEDDDYTGFSIEEE